MQKRTKSILAVLTLMLFGFVTTGCSSQTADNTNGINVKTAAADKHAMQTTVDVAGVLVPAQTVNIVSKISGQVTNLNFDIGNSVKAGDTLITLETKTLDAQLKQAEAALQSAQAAVQAAGDQADQAKINLDAAEKTYKNTKTLFASSAASQTQLDNDTTKYELAKKQYEIASGSAQKQAQASVNTAQANINNIKVQMENATITSPINGIITNRNLNPGEIASPGAPILAIADTSTVKLKGTVPQQVVPLLQVGQDIEVSVDIYPNKTYKGKITNIGPIAVSTGEYFPIEISINNSGDIKAGLSAHTSIKVTVNEDVIIPASAVVQNNGQSYVYVVKNNIASKRIVTLGLKNDKEIAILKGLDAGEKVVTTNTNSLFDNMPITSN